MVGAVKRRDDEAAVKAAARDLTNCAIHAAGGLDNRPGRRALFRSEGRTDEVRMAPSATYRLCFGEGTLTVRDSAGAIVARAWGYEWTAANADTIVWARFENDIVICFDGQVPKIARWDGGTEWTFLDFAFEVTGNQKRCPFYRIAPKGISMTPSAATGSITITFDEDVLVSGMIGDRFRYHDKQMTLTAVTGPRSGTATVNEALQGAQTLTFSSSNPFSVGDVLYELVNGTGVPTGASGQVTGTGGSTATVSLLSAAGFQGGSFTIACTTPYVSSPAPVISSVATSSPPASVVWDQEVMTDYQGWPRSVTVDQSRLIFADLPAVPHGISWSVIGLATDHFIGTAADDGFFELVPQRARVYHVMGGADEFVFTDAGVYYIPISTSSPLQPGSVDFRLVPSVPASAVRPLTTGQGLLYVAEDLDAVAAIVGTGQTAQPYLVRPVSDLHADLFEDVVCLAVENKPDAKVYAVNADGTLAIGRYQPGKEWVGWVPWEGEGAVGWASAVGSSVLLSTDYGDFTLVEQVDAAAYLDAQVPPNAIPAALSASAGAALLLPTDQGTPIGDLTSSGGLAAAFDGTTAQASAASATKATATSGYVGKTLGQRFRIAKAEAWGSSDNGFTTGGATVTLTLYGKQGAAPANATDGTSLVTSGSIADTTSMVTLTSSDTATEWDHVWLTVAASSGTIAVAELRLYSPGDAAQTGSLWFLEGTDVLVMDGLRLIGERTIASGEIDLEEGDDFSGAGIRIGYGWSMRAEPFVGHVQGGASVGQTVTRRNMSTSAVAVQDSTGFQVEMFRPDPSQDNDDGAWEAVSTAAAYRAGENQDIAPPQRECVHEFNANGADHDPRIRVVKSTPGTLRVLEIDVQITA